MSKKEELEEQIRSAEENIKYFESRVNDNKDLKSKLEAELEESEKQEEQEWKPEMGEIYWFVDLDVMKVVKKCWANSEVGNMRLQHKVVFKTKDEAEEYLEYLKAKEKAINEFSKEEWENPSIEKHYIYCTYSREIFEIGCYFSSREMNAIHFRTNKDAQEFIDKYEKFMRRELGL